MGLRITRVEIRYEQDLVHARQRTRLISELLGFDRNDQTRLCTAVSEIARNAYQYGGGGDVEFQMDMTASPQLFSIIIRDHGPGIKDLEAILEGHYASQTGMGIGITGTRRLMDMFQLETGPGKGTTISFGKKLPAGSPPVTAAVLKNIGDKLAATRTESSPLDEIRTQNLELMGALSQLRQREDELTRLNLELTTTNARIVALNASLNKKTEQLQHSENRLLARNAELTDFAHTISHDLKAPLRGINGYARELDRKHRDELNERALFCISQILTATRNLDGLIDDLLRYSRLDADLPAPTEVNLRALIETILQDHSLMLAEQHTQVSLDVPSATLETWERGLTQVLTNLIDNALKYSGKVSTPRINIRAEQTSHTWRLSVSDNGIGFDMKQHDRIFGLFNRLVRMDEYEGTGAGLAIAKKVMEKMGGRIWAESAPGQGATFHVELPQTAPPAA